MVYTNKEDRAVREYLAFSHTDGFCFIYGDDGELQCNNIGRHGRCLDFKRDPIESLILAIQACRLREVSDEHNQRT